MNIINELGVDYARDRFSGCMFVTPDKQIATVAGDRSWPDSGVAVNYVTGDINHLSTVTGIVPRDFFKDLSVFKTPPLGWRMNADGRYLAIFSRNNRSYHRAVAMRNLDRLYSPVTQFLFNEGYISVYDYETEAMTTKMVMDPQYIPLREAIGKIKSGEIMAAACTPNIALIPEVDGKLSILFNHNKVGEVRTNGSVHCTIPSISSMLEVA